MQTIRYIFSDGTTSEIEVTDEFYEIYAELVQQEKRNHWKEISNLSLKEQYTNIQQSEPKTWAAFCRRITAVYDFDKSKEIPVNKFTGELKKPPTLIEIADDGDMPF